MPRLSTLHKHKDAHDQGIWTGCWVPNKNWILTGSLDESVKVFIDDTSAEQQSKEGPLREQHNYSGFTLGAISLAADAKGAYAACSSLDSIVRVWSLDTGHITATLEHQPTECWSLAFGPSVEDGLLLALACGTKENLSLWRVNTDADEHQELAQMGLQESQSANERHRRERFLLSVSFSPDGRLVACGGMDGGVAVFDAETHSLVARLRGHNKPVRALCFTPDSSQLLTASDDMHSNLYALNSGELIDSFSGHESWVLSVSCNPDGKMFATGSSDARVKLWDLGQRECVQTVAEHTDQVWQVAFSHDGTRLVSLSDDKSLVLHGYT